MIGRLSKIAAFAACVSAIFSVAPASGAQRPPFVGVMNEAPVLIAGARFKPSERVTVRVLVFGFEQLTTVVKARRDGGFAARFPQLTIPECRGYVITAIGSKGSRATKREYVMEPCGIAPQP